MPVQAQCEWVIVAYMFYKSEREESSGAKQNSLNHWTLQDIYNRSASKKTSHKTCISDPKGANFTWPLIITNLMGLWEQKNWDLISFFFSIWSKYQTQLRGGYI